MSGLEEYCLWIKTGLDLQDTLITVWVYGLEKGIVSFPVQATISASPALNSHCISPGNLPLPCWDYSQPIHCAEFLFTFHQYNHHHHLLQLTFIVISCQWPQDLYSCTVMGNRNSPIQVLKELLFFILHVLFLNNFLFELELDLFPHSFSNLKLVSLKFKSF